MLELDKKIKDSERFEQLEHEARIKAMLRNKEEEAEVARQVRQEKLGLELEKKRLELAETKRVQTKLPD